MVLNFCAERGNNAMSALTTAEARGRRGAGDIGLSTLLEDLLDAVPGQAATIYTPQVAPDEPGGIWRAFGMPAEALSDYAAHFRDLDPWARAASRGSPPPTGAVIDTDRLLDVELLRRSAFHDDYLARYDIGRCLVAIVDDGRGPALPRIRMTVVRAASEPAFSAADVARMAQLSRLSRSFVSLATAYDEASRATQLHRAAFDLVTMPVLLVDRDRRVQSANRAAVGLMQAAGPILLRQGRVHARDAGADREFGQALLRAADDPGDVRFVRFGPGRRSPALVISSPPDLDGVMVVRLLDPAVSMADGATLLRVLLDLTPAESAVALGIAEGLSHDDIARRRGVKVTTVRTTLRRLQEKLGIQKTGPLARFIHGIITLGGLRL